MVTVIIPAFNEAASIAQAVSETTAHPWVTEVIVVDDGSCDKTAAVAAEAGARVIRLSQNSGKADAMDAGVRAAGNDVLMFADADVCGRTPETMRRIMEPVLQGRYEMYVGIRARSTVWLNRLLHFFPIIGGERALTRRLWESLPANHKRGFQIEIALNYTAKQFERSMGFELINGTVHHTKEQKYGLTIGLLRRMSMIGDVLSISFRLYIMDAAGRLIGRLGRTIRSRTS